MTLFFIFSLVFIWFSTVSASKYCSEEELYITCRNVKTIRDLQGEWQSNWTALRVVNQPFDNFVVLSYLSITSLKSCSVPKANNPISDQRFSRAIKDLDLSAAGQVILYTNGLSVFPSLEVANLSGTGLTDFHVEWFPPKTMSLDVSHNIISNLGETIFPPKTIMRHLKLAYNRISQMPVDFLKGAVVYLLDLSHNEFQQLRDIGAVHLIHVLKISNNFISKIERADLSGVPTVTVLDVSNNNISFIEDGVFTFTARLNVLNLTGNALTKISASLFGNEHNTRLTKILLAHNKLTQIESNAFKSLDELHTLDLSGNRLRTIDGSIFGSPKPRFKHFYLSKNMIRFLPTDLFEHIENVLALDLSHNQFTFFDERIFTTLKRINKLILSYNFIIEFPPEAYDMFRLLTELAIDHNKLTFLNLDKDNIRHLKNITISDNPWQCSCLDELIILLDTAKIDYQRGLCLSGEKPICVESKFKICIKDLQKAQDGSIYDL